MDIIESNILIAEFMGVDYVDIDTYLENNKELQYHKDWNWLMPVIARLTSLVPIEISQGITPFMLLDNIDRVHGEVVEIIEWHNQRQQS